MAAWWLAITWWLPKFHVHLVEETLFLFFPASDVMPKLDMIPWRKPGGSVAEAWRKLRGRSWEHTAHGSRKLTPASRKPHGSSSGRVFFKCPMSMKFLKFLRKNTLLTCTQSHFGPRLHSKGWCNMVFLLKRVTPVIELQCLTLCEHFLAIDLTYLT